MEDDAIILWVLDNMAFIKSTNKPTPEQMTMLFKVADQVDATQKHKPTSCGSCITSAKNAIKRNLPTLFE